MPYKAVFAPNTQLQIYCAHTMEKKRSYQELMGRFEDIARRVGARMSPIGDFTCPLGDYSIYQILLETGNAQQKIVISAGMHGDEPASCEALLKTIELIDDRRDRLNAQFLIFPCDNPTGWELDTRENYLGLDLNREFAKEGQAVEIALVEQTLRGREIHFTLDLHEDIDVYGMYLYERTRKGKIPLAEEMIQALRHRGYPIHEEDWIEGLPATGGIIWPSGRLRKFELPKAVYLWHSGVGHLITTESPGKLDLTTRVEMQMVCVEVFLDALEQERFLPAEGTAANPAV